MLCTGRAKREKWWNCARLPIAGRKGVWELAPSPRKMRHFFGSKAKSPGVPVLPLAICQTADYLRHQSGHCENKVRLVPQGTGTTPRFRKSRLTMTEPE